MIENFLKELNEQGIELWLEDEKLKYKASKRSMTPAIMQELKEKKSEIIAYLKCEKQSDNKIHATRNQIALWLERKMGAEGGSIHNGMIKKITGNLSYEVVKEAFQFVMERHQALRSVFYEEDGEVLIQIQDVSDNFFTVKDCEGVSEEEIIEEAKKDADETMDLVKGPLFRVNIYKQNEQTHIISFWAHHIISDAYSLYVIQKEFLRYYAQKQLGMTFRFDDVKEKYIESIRYEEEYRKSPQFKEGLQYWRNNLSQDVQGTTLAKLKMDLSDGYGYEPVSLIDTYGLELTDKMKKYAKDNHITVYMLSLACISIVLQEFNESNESVLGVFMLNRMMQDFAYRDIVGYFSNSVVFQTKLEKNELFSHYLKKVKSQMVEVLDYQQVPFPDVVSDINPIREGKHPFFKVAFDSVIFKEDKEDNMLSQKLNITDVDIIKGGGDYDLIIWMSEDEDGFNMDFRYNNLLFDAYQIKSLAESIKTLIINACDQEDASVEEIGFLSDSSRKLFDSVNATEVALPDTTTVQIIQETCMQNKDEIAVVCQNENITYGQLLENANKIASFLIDSGVQPGECIGIMMEKTCYLPAAVLGVWIAGAVYSPIDPRFPKNRKEYIIEMSQMKVMLEDTSFQVDIADTVQSIHVRELLNTVTNIRTEFPMAKKEDIAYVIYTSGSTGLPKGVAIRHESLLNFLFDMKKRCKIQHDDSIMQITSISFDISILELMLPLLCGCRMIMLTHDEAMDGRKILNSIREHHITVMQATPNSFHMLYEFFQNEKAKDVLLRLILCGGEGYDLDLVERLNQMAEHVINVYGPTETTIWSTTYDFPKECKEMFIGYPMANTKVYVVNEKNKILPEGVPGELCIGGAGVFDGYYHNEQMTKERTTIIDKEVFYKTGDFAYFTEEGILHFLGRRDSQVKIRGFRIELSEIEIILKRYEGVSDAAVIVVESSDSVNLAAFVVLDTEQKDVSSITEFVARYLPDYMIPNHIFVTDKLPLTNNRKVDRKTLKEMYQNIMDSNNVATVKEEALNEAEEKVMNLWSDVLGKKIMTRNTGFFEVGGNSILLNKLMNKIEIEFGITVNIVQLLKYNTVQKMSNYIQGHVTNQEEKQEQQEQVVREEKQVSRRSDFLKRRRR